MQLADGSPRLRNNELKELRRPMPGQSALPVPQRRPATTVRRPFSTQRTGRESLLIPTPGPTPVVVAVAVTTPGAIAAVPDIHDQIFGRCLAGDHRPIDRRGQAGRSAGQSDATRRDHPKKHGTHAVPPFLPCLSAQILSASGTPIGGISHASGFPTFGPRFWPINQSSRRGDERRMNAVLSRG